MTAALIPVKSLRDGKTRLSATFSPEQRHELTLAMLNDVLDAVFEAGLWPVTVVSADSDVLADAVSRGARGLVEPEKARGLNAAIGHGLNVLQRHGSEQAIVLLPDVPTVQASDLREVAGLLAEHQVVVVPSDDGGTNALGLRLPPQVAPAFGPDSAARHTQSAWLAEVFFAVRPLASLHSDIDEPADVERFLEGGRGNRTRQALRRFGCGAPVA